AGARPAPVRIRAADITGTRYKPGSLLMHGYVQFVLPGSLAAGEKRGIAHGGRPPYSDPHSLSIPRKSNAAAQKLVAAVEQARGGPVTRSAATRTGPPAPVNGGR